MLLSAAVSWAVMILAAAQQVCDPVTQYEKEGQCCKMCNPGTSMSETSTCQNPQCVDCKDDEYQDKYTISFKCKRQPYCDPNKNFMDIKTQSKKEKSVCLCKTGFHCSSEACITCVQHTECGPGYEAKSIGNHTHDTLCQKCPHGTFSNISSWKSVCQKWTECGAGNHIRTEGTAQTDIICETSRQHIAWISVLVCISVILVIFGFVYWKCRGNLKDNVKDCVESCCGEKPNETPREIYNPITHPHETQPIFTAQVSTQEEGSGSVLTPEENLDEQSIEQSSYPRTENGNFVTQEKGKSEILSQESQDSQSQTYTDSFKSLTRNT